MVDIANLRDMVDTNLGSRGRSKRSKQVDSLGRDSMNLKGFGVDADAGNSVTFKPLDLDKAGPPKDTANSLAIDKQTDAMKKSNKAAAVAGAGVAVMDIINAYGEYTNRVETAKTNIMLAEQDIMSITSAGKQASFAAEAKGQSRGQSALLGAALQGQDVRGAFAQQVQHQEELFGIMESLSVEVNAIRQAHGVEQEIILQESEMDAARSDFEMQRANAVVRGGISIFSGGF